MKINPRSAAVLVACLMVWLAVCGPVASADRPIIRRDRSATYKAGQWTYVYSITHPGTRSQGALGKLLYDGRPLPPPDDPRDYYDSPLGRFYHAGTPEVPWGDHGWMPADPAAPAGEGRPLALPDSDSTRRQQTIGQMEKLLAALTADGSESPYLKDPPGDEFLSTADAWGRRYKIFQDRRGGEGEGMVARLELTSAGGDGRFGTADDIVRASNFIGISAPGNGISNADALTESNGSPVPQNEARP